MPADLFGRTMCGLGDVNGDGFGDILVGIPEATHLGGTRAGRVKVYSGLNSLLLYVVDGLQDDHQVGKEVSALGDINGDGVRDFILGSPNFGGPGISKGTASIHSGANGSLIRSFTGANGEFLGTSVGNANDVDGDGFADLIVTKIVTSPGNALMSPQIEIISGATGNLIRTTPNAQAPNANLTGEFAALGDVDGDSVSDYSIEYSGSPLFARVFSGATGSLISRVDGIEPLVQEFGTFTITALGDLNNDGFGEMGLVSTATPFGASAPTERK